MRWIILSTYCGTNESVIVFLNNERMLFVTLIGVIALNKERTRYNMLLIILRKGATVPSLTRACLTMCHASTRGAVMHPLYVEYCSIFNLCNFFFFFYEQSYKVFLHVYFLNVKFRNEKFVLKLLSDTVMIFAKLH